MPRPIITSNDDFTYKKSNSVNKQELSYEADEDTIPVREQKWRKPKEGLEMDILKASRPMVKFPKFTTHEEKKAIQDIRRGALSLQGGVIGRYPLEWVEHCIHWCRDLWRQGKPMSLDNLIKYINNADKMNDWVAQWGSKNHVTLQYSKQVEKNETD